MDTDAVDEVVAQWRQERPDLAPDLEAMATFGRLARLAALATPAVEAALRPFGLKVGEFDVLASLRRAGGGCELTPTALGRHLLLSSGAMTNRLDRLEAAGLVQRRPDPADRRGVLVALTSRGRELVDEAVTAHVANEAALLASLDADARRALDDALRTLLRSLSDPDR